MGLKRLPLSGTRRNVSSDKTEEECLKRLAQRKNDRNDEATRNSSSYLLGRYLATFWPKANEHFFVVNSKREKNEQKRGVLCGYPSEAQRVAIGVFLSFFFLKFCSFCFVFAWANLPTTLGPTQAGNTQPVEWPLYISEAAATRWGRPQQGRSSAVCGQWVEYMYGSATSESRLRQLTDCALPPTPAARSDAPYLREDLMLADIQSRPS